MDSNVLISLLNREMGRGVRGLFVEAEAFFERIKEGEHTLVLSNWFFREVKKITYLSRVEILEYFNKLGINVDVVEQKGKLNLSEFSSKGLRFPDSLHAAIAVAQKCECIVTFNIKDFKGLEDRIAVLEPLDFI